MQYKLTPEIKERCEALLDQLTGANLDHLARFAAWRLKVAEMSPSRAGDFVQEAVRRIETGLETGAGRKPTLAQVASMQAFGFWVKGIISSIIEARGRQRDKNTAHEFNDEMVPTRRANQPDEQAATNERRDELFARLRQQASPDLMEVIDAWEPISLEDDHIPIINGNRKKTWRVRQLARKIMAESEQPG